VELTRLVGEEDDCIAKHDEDVADFFAVALAALALIAKDIGITPQAKEAVPEQQAF
jgi:hypothetical protein